MSVDGEELDRGVQRSMRMWNTHKTVPETFRDREVKKAYMFRYEAESIGKGVDAFDGADNTAHVSATIGALCQLFWRTIQQISHDALQVRNPLSAGLNAQQPKAGSQAAAAAAAQAAPVSTDTVYPISVMLELCPESEESARAYAKTVGKVTGVRETILREVHQITEEALREMEQESNRGGDTSPLLAGVRDRRIIEYRFWVLVHSSTVDFPSAMQRVIKLAGNAVAERTTVTTLMADNKMLQDYRRNMKASGSSNQSSHLVDFRMSKIVERLERWALLSSRSKVLDAFVIYTNDKRFLDDEIRAVCLATSFDLANPQNPAHIDGIFSAAVQFKRTNPALERSQREFCSYYEIERDSISGDQSGAAIWKFPHGNRVLIIPPDDHTMSTLLRYLPDHQLRQSCGAKKRLDLERAQAIIARPNIPSDLAEARRARRMLVKNKAQLAAPIQNDMLVDKPPAKPFDDDDDHDDKADQSSASRRQQAYQAADDGNDTGDEDEFVAGGAASINDVRNRALQAEAVALGELSNQPGLTMEQKSASLILQCANRSGLEGVIEATPVMIDMTVDKTAFASELVGKHDLLDAQVRQRKKEIDAALAGNANASLIRTLAKQYEQRAADCRTLPTDRERAAVHTLDQNAAFNDYTNMCTKPLSEVSDIGRTINAFAEKAALLGENYFKNVRFFDKQLSTFGHMMVRDMTVLDKLYHTHTCHRTLFVLESVLMEAYRDERALHLNALLLGAPGQSKSHGIEYLERRAIPGTVMTISRRTLASWSTEGDLNGRCECWHELSRQLLVDPAEHAELTSNGNSSGKQNNSSGNDTALLDQFKAKLTDMFVQTNENRKDANGEWREVSRKSEQIMTYIGATNLERALIASAIQSRFVVLELNDLPRRDASMSDKENARKNMTREGRVLRDRADWEFRLRQIIFKHVEDLIAIGAIARPTLAVWMVCAPIFLEVCTKYAIKTPIRAMLKLELFIRHLVIRLAIFRLWAAPNAKYKGRQFEIDQLKDIDPLLFDTEELVYAAMEMMASQYIEPNRAIVIRALRRMVATQLATPEIFETRRSERTRHHGDASSTTAGGYSKIVPGFQWSRQRQEQGTSGAKVYDNPTPKHWHELTRNEPGYDFNRVVLRKSLMHISLELESEIAASGDARLNHKQIQRILQMMSHEAMRRHAFVPNQQFDGVLTKDSLPVVKDIASEERSTIVCAISSYDQTISLHSALFFEDAHDPIEEAIQLCINAHTPAGKMVRGCQLATDLPQFWATRDVVPNPNTVHTFSNDSQINVSDLCMLGDNASDDRVQESEVRKAFAWLSSKKCTLGVSLDEYASMRRMVDVELPLSAAALFSITTCDLQIRANPNYYVAEDKQINYPEKVALEESTSKELIEIRKIYKENSLVEAQAKLKNRVVYLTSVQTDPIERAMTQQLFRQFGIDPTINEQHRQEWEAEKEAQEAERNKQRELRRIEVAKLAKAFAESEGVRPADPNETTVPKRGSKRPVTDIDPALDDDPNEEISDDYFGEANKRAKYAPAY